MNPFLSHPLQAEHKSGEMQGWYTRLRVFLNQLLRGDNVTAGPGITVERAHNGFTISSCQYFVLSSDESTGSNTDPINLTDLVWEFEADSIYVFKWIGNVSPATATTGCGFQLLIT